MIEGFAHVALYTDLLDRTVHAKIAFVKGVNGEQIELFEEML